MKILALVLLLSVKSYGANRCETLFSSAEQRRPVTEEQMDNLLVGTPLDSLKADKLEAKLVQLYSQYAREFKETPSFQNFANYLGLREAALREVLQRIEVENLNEIKRQAFLKNPKAFNLVRDMDFYNKKYSEQLLEEARNYSRILVTTAISGHKTNTDALNALLNMAEKMDAIIWVIPADRKTTFLDPVLLKHPRIRILTHSVQLAKDLSIYNTAISVKGQNPLSSLERDGGRGEVSIYGSPKIHSRTLATRDNNILQHIQYTTGTISEATPYNAAVVAGKSDALAAKDHMISAIVIEKTMGENGFVSNLNLQRTGKFNVRIARFVKEEKGFSDVSGFYTANEVRSLTYKAMNPGDLHILKTDARMMEAMFKLIRSMKGLEYMMAHDPFDGRSVSHWEAKDFVAMTLKAQKGELNVREELLWNVAFYNRVFKENKSLKVVVPPANHNDWLSRWIRDKRFLEDPYNVEIGKELFDAMMKGVEPYEYFIMKHVDAPERMVFLKQGQPFKVGPDYRATDLANHGDKGANGARGSMKSYQVGYESTMFGHTHRYEEKGDTFNIGTSTYLILDYNKDGLSSWAQAVGLIDQYGQRQVLIFKNGEWLVGKKSLKEARGNHFFEESMPKLLPNLNEQTDRNRPKTTFEMEDES